ncbi:MAG: hypothetical protein H0W88_04750 [Parachlamydiaceae bacterium]|nr:hypothetical protein [Parachlamydiaceae bacterium]
MNLINNLSDVNLCSFEDVHKLKLARDLGIISFSIAGVWMEASDFIHIWRTDLSLGDKFWALRERGTIKALTRSVAVGSFGLYYLFQDCFQCSKSM